MIYYVIKVHLNNKSTGYYTGDGVDSDAKMAKIYRSPQMTNMELNHLVSNKHIKIASIVKITKHSKKRAVKKRTVKKKLKIQ